MTRPPLILFVCFIACAPFRLTAQSPGGVSANLTLWVKADSAYPITGGTLTKWTDLKGTNTFTKVGTAATINLNTINFHPVVHWTGAGTLKGSTSIIWSECTAVATWDGSPNSERGTVVSPLTSGTAPGDASRYYFRSGTEGSTGYVYAGMGADSIGFEYIDAPPEDQANIYTASGFNDVFNKNGLNAKVGSLYGGFTKRGTSMNGTPQIGDRSTSDSKMKGDIAEIVVYKTNNATNRNKVESYLALKYGITLGTTASSISYTSSAGTVFWTGNATYQRNVFGIGTDNASGLTQTKSNSMTTGSGNGAGQSGAGNLVLTSNALSNQQFLMIGNDAGSLAETTINGAMGPSNAIGSKRVGRNWKVQNTGAVGAVKLTFEKTGLSLTGNNTASNYWLVIDNDGDGNYTTGTQSDIMASSVAANIITFNSVTLNNNVVFTLITKPSTVSTLPVVWEDFKASARQNTVTLQWTTSNEDDVDRFVIERSVDAIAFTQTGSVMADNGSGLHPYESRVEEPLSGDYYYRIRAIDRDGAPHFSGIRSVRIEAPIVMQIRSNPVQGQRLELDINLPKKDKVMIWLADRQGNPILHQERSLQQGDNFVTIDLSAAPAGLYFVQMRAGSQASALSFLKY